MVIGKKKRPAAHQLGMAPRYSPVPGRYPSDYGHVTWSAVARSRGVEKAVEIHQISKKVWSDATVDHKVLRPQEPLSTQGQPKQAPGCAQASSQMHQAKAASGCAPRVYGKSLDAPPATHLHTVELTLYRGACESFVKRLCIPTPQRCAVPIRRAAI